jgi:hypothetical protein
MLFSATLFMSAFLLFWVQPLFAKMILPLLGGSPSVWNTCMVFFQAVLLAGYLYADFSARRLRPALQPLVHLALLLVVFLVLPLAVPAGWQPPATSNPAPWLILLLVVTVGLPAFALSCTAPLVQSWFSRSGHPAAADPYFLYGASNFGSMLALLGYPILIEPSLALQEQSHLWTGAFGLFVLCLLGCSTVVWRTRTAPATTPKTDHSEPGGSPPPTLRQKGGWLLLSFVPSSLLLGVTTHMTTDVAAVPLLWVFPLALYLGTFVIAFARKPVLPHRAMLAVQPFFLLLLGVAYFQQSVLPLLAFPVHLLAFFATAMVCHGELAARRPAPARLTTFYLWLSLGGVLGGAFNALLAPLLFNSVAEYALLVVAAVFLRPNFRFWRQHRPWLDYLLPAAVLAALALSPAMAQKADVSFHGQLFFNLGVAIAAAAMVFLLRARPLGLGLGVGAMIAAGYLVSPHQRTLLQERNFFGVLRVADFQNLRIFFHGKIMHGAQSLDPARRDEPLLYHSPEGPLGEIFSAFSQALQGQRIAVAGLGAGAMAAYGQPGQHWVFYELDPAVARIARDERYFSFLARSKAAVEIVIGDARLKLAEAPDGSYAMIVLDAFSSDAVPAHLLTREALFTYLRKLSPGGVLAYNISNAYIDLQPVVHALAADAGVTSAIRWGGGSGTGGAVSAWVVMARSLRDLEPLQPYPDWYRTTGRAGFRPWTDSYSNIFNVLKIR